MTARDARFSHFIDQEETSIMESPKRESSEWTDEKQSLYLKSMEASFVDQLYNSLDMRSWQTQNDCSSEAISSMKNHTSTRCPSGQFKVLRHGFWSRIDFKRDNLGRNEEAKPHLSSSNLWIQHFRNGNTPAVTESPSPQEKVTSQQFQQTGYSDTEVTDQNFVEEDSAVQKVKTKCRKKWKSTSAVSEAGNNQAGGSFGHFSYNGNR